MATDKQLQANRRNARRSTGPRSEAGKARSRLNSRKHGLTAKTLIIIGECADDFDRLRAELREELDPQSVLESELVERLTGIIWRLRRMPFFETAILDARRQQVAEERRELQELQFATQPGDREGSEEPSCQSKLGEDDAKELRDRSVTVGDALTQDAAFGDALGKLARHEAHLMRGLTKTLEALDELRESVNTERRAVMLNVVPFSPAS